jgi:hypothetical protein
VGELNRESLECVAFRNVVFNSLLKFFACKGSSPDPLIFVVGKSCGKQVSQLGIPLGSQVMIVPPDRTNFIFEDILEQHLFFHVI